LARRQKEIFEDAGEHRVKNIATPVRAFQLRTRPNDAIPGSEDPSALTHGGGSSIERASKGNLPRSQSKLYGRAKDVEDLLSVLASSRLVTDKSNTRSPTERAPSTGLPIWI